MRYVPALNGVRAIAVLLVFLRHSTLETYAPEGVGAVGVGIFFALSGFLITTVLLSERERTGSVRLRAFFGRRARRLLPALGVMLLIVTAVAVVLQRTAVFGAVAAAALYCANWAHIYGWTNGRAVGHAWSLAIEEHFYLLWPLLFVALIRRFTLHRAALVTAGLCAAAVSWRLVLLATGSDSLRLQYGSDTRADALLIGCVVAMATFSRPWRPPPVVVAASWLAIVALTFLGASSTPMLSFGVTLLAVASSLVVLDVWRGGSVAASVLSWSPLVGLGRISYGFYLWHFPIAYFALSHLPGPWALRSVPLFALSLAASVASFRFVEQPFQRLKSQVSTQSGTFGNST